MYVHIPFLQTQNRPNIKENYYGVFLAHSSVQWPFAFAQILADAHIHNDLSALVSLHPTLQVHHIPFQGAHSSLLKLLSHFISSLSVTHLPTFRSCSVTSSRKPFEFPSSSYILPRNSQFCPAVSQTQGWEHPESWAPADFATGP